MASSLMALNKPFFLPIVLFPDYLGVAAVSLLPRLLIVSFKWNVSGVYLSVC